MADSHSFRVLKRREFKWAFIVALLVVVQLGVYFRSSSGPTLSLQTTKFDAGFAYWYKNRSSATEIKAAISELKVLFQEKEDLVLNLSSRLLAKEEQIQLLQSRLLTWMANQTIHSTGRSDSPHAPPQADGHYFHNPIEENKTRCHLEHDGSPAAKKRLKKFITWRPRPGMYLLAMCSGGQFSNRLACIRQSMLDAALLNRTLLFPANGMGYDYENLLDLKKPSLCFGNNTFLTLDEYWNLKGSRESGLLVDRLFCHVHAYQIPRKCVSLRNRFGRVGVRFNRTEVIQAQTPGPWFKYPRKEFLAKFAVEDAIIGFGNMFGAGGREYRFDGCGPLKVSQECTYYLSPSVSILQTAAGYVNSVLGKHYIGIHMRRGDFFEHCVRPNGANRHPLPCFYPLQRLAECIAYRAEAHPGAAVVFLATNGDADEFQSLQSMLSRWPSSSHVTLLRLGSLDDAHWAQPLRKSGLHNNSDVVAMVEKTVCMLSSVFYGTSGSTFSTDIERLRDWFGTRSAKDSVLCPMNLSTEFVSVPS